MYALYAFMRFTDDLIDAIPPFAGDPSLNVRPSLSIVDFSSKDRLGQWRLLVKSQFPLSATLTPVEIQNIREEKDFDERILMATLLFPSLVESVKRFQIPPATLFAVIDGVEMDLTKNRYQNFEELQLYCERVASAVGLACIHVWGFDGQGTSEQEPVDELARKVGIAYQLTNILRDLKEDAAMDRVYLPLDEITATGYSLEELKKGVVNAAFEKLMRSQIQRAEDYYLASRELYGRLKPEGKKIFGLMTATYHAILKRIAANPAAVFTSRIRPGKFARLRLAAKWTCFAPKELKL